MLQIPKKSARITIPTSDWSDICHIKKWEKLNKSTHPIIRAILETEEKDAKEETVYIKFANPELCTNYCQKFNQKKEEKKSAADNTQILLTSSKCTLLSALEAVYSAIYSLYIGRSAARTVALIDDREIIGTVSYAFPGQFITYQELMDDPRFAIQKSTLFNLDSLGKPKSFNITQGLASILMASYFFQEDDLHRENFGFVVPASGKINEGYWVRLDYGRSFIVARKIFSGKRPLYDPRGKYPITGRDLADFPYLEDAYPFYWPWKSHTLLSENCNFFTAASRRHRYSTKDHILFSTLPKTEIFKQEKHEFLLKLFLIPGTLVECYTDQISFGADIRGEFRYRSLMLQWAALCDTDFRAYIRNLKKNPSLLEETLKKIVERIPELCTKANINEYDPYKRFNENFAIIPECASHKDRGQQIASFLEPITAAKEDAEKNKNNVLAEFYDKLKEQLVKNLKTRLESEPFETIAQSLMIRLTREIVVNLYYLPNSEQKRVVEKAPCSLLRNLSTNDLDLYLLNIYFVLKSHKYFSKPADFLAWTLFCLALLMTAVYMINKLHHLSTPFITTLFSVTTIPYLTIPLIAAYLLLTIIFFQKYNLQKGIDTTSKYHPIMIQAIASGSGLVSTSIALLLLSLGITATNPIIITILAVSLIVSSTILFQQHKNSCGFFAASSRKDLDALHRLKRVTSLVPLSPTPMQLVRNE